MDSEKSNSSKQDSFEKLDQKYEEGKEGLDKMGVSEEDYQRAYIEVGELAEKGNVRFWDSSKSFQNSEIQTMNLDEVPVVSKEELNAALAEGKELWQKLKSSGFHPDMTPAEVLEVIKKRNLSETLKEWARINKRNTGLIMKQPGGAPYLSPTTDLFLRAAELLKG
jgi:hypothetical protein